MMGTYHEEQRAKILTRRSANVYSNQRRRAKEMGQQLPYTLGELRSLINAALNQPCLYCGDLIHASNFSLDHGEPVCRGGPLHITNLVVSCDRCNQIKGNMTAEEFHTLLATVATFPPLVRRNVLARLRAGGKMIRGR